MQRYDVDYLRGILPGDDGEYVLYADHLEEISHTIMLKDAENHELKSQLELATLGEGEALSMLEFREAQVIRQKAEIAVLKDRLKELENKCRQ